MKNFSGVCQAAGADKPLRAFFIWITNIVTWTLQSIEAFKVLNGLNQNHAETDSTDTQKGIEGYRRSFDSDVVNQKYQQAEHCGRITENVDDNALAVLRFDELTIVCRALFYIVQFDIREHSECAIHR